MQSKRFYLSILFVLQFLHVNAQTTLFSLLPPDSTGVNFVNIIKDTKDLNVIKYEYYYNGGGVAIGDVNNDGLPDLYFSSNVNECRLYLNEGNLKFKDVTKEAGVGAAGGYHTGVTFVDINNDGWMDIYVCQSVAADTNARKNILFENNKDGTFTNKAAQYGIADAGISVAGYFNDLDGDGDLDLFVINDPYNIDFAKTIHLAYNSQNVLAAVQDTITYYESDHYYENVNGKYIEKTAAAGLRTHSFGLSAILQDFNGDGLTDIYQANDYLKPDYLFINQGNRKFINEFEKFFNHSSYSSMGSDYADLNNDGFSDLMTDDMLPEGNERQKQLRGGNNYDEFDKVVKYGYGYQYVKNVLQLNNGNNTYSDISYFTGMAYSEWSWAILMADFDNDAWKDVYIANGYMRDITDMDYVKFKMDSIKKVIIKVKSNEDVSNLLSAIPQVKVLKCYFKNYGGLNFKREITSTGLTQAALSFGAAYGDLDNDGDLDLVVNNTNDFAFVYRNNTMENKTANSIRIQLNGPEKNRTGIGTKIETVTPDHIKQVLIYNPEKGYLSCNDKTNIVGIGQNTSCNIHVTWPDGKQQLLNDVKANQLLILNYADAKDTTVTVLKNKTLFADITTQTKVDYSYTENQHIDFKLEPLLPHKFSQMGPCVTVADFTGDKLDDFFVGGAKDHAAILFSQNADGTFTKTSEPVFDADKLYEDGAAASFDFDGDGDNDLIVSSGGNDYPNDNSKYPVRVYLNDGKGNFSKSKASNKYFTSANSIAVSDFNKDGSPDIFIGGRTVPGHYGLIPKSFLLTVSGDTLKDITSTTVLGNIGMVSTVQWSDINNDGWKDLVLAGEWLPITYVLNTNGLLNGVPEIIDNTYGWWNKISIIDIDNDGDMDIVGGNLGMNTRYKGTTDRPVTMVASDFDNNGSTDCLISTYVKGKSYPIAIRDYTLDQMPYLRKKYLRYAPYSLATVNDIFTPEQIEKANKFVANDMYSTVFINDGKGIFAKVNLPTEAQFFPVNGIQFADVNHDNLPDLIMVGNDYSTEVETGRNDAGIGLVLLNLGGGAFKTMPVTQSGFFIPGDVKCLEKIIVGDKTIFIAGKNKDQLQLVELEK
ncbi:hypothetical protein LBMAG27_20990 [Bacteroidota bacterium]|nr:hypothetical protein LBMAG27_20990 [Bacteroidota bacterium]